MINLTPLELLERVFKGTHECQIVRNPVKPGERIIGVIHNEMVPKLHGLVRELTEEYIGKETGIPPDIRNSLAAICTLLFAESVRQFGDELRVGEALSLRFHQGEWVLVGVEIVGNKKGADPASDFVAYTPNSTRTESFGS
jgi:hypothetical protein